MDVDLRLLRYFLVLAEELHFTRAAERLYLSQPALSNQIRRLERVLGLELFERTSRGVSLTAAGDAFVPRAREALAAVSRGVAEAAAAAGQDETLRIDLLASGLDTPRAVLGRLRTTLPSVRLEITSTGSADQNRRLLAGELDLALCGAGAATGPEIAEQVVRREPVGVALPADHRLATAEAVGLAVLADEVHYLPRDGFAPEWNAYVLASCRSAGFVPRRHPASTDGTDTAMDLVRAGECVALSLLSTEHPPGTVVRPLTGPVPLYPWSLRWRRADPLPARIDSVRTAVRDLARARSWTVD
ncbi:MAG: LysR family transcriptional regulator [Kribbellaceae bacterium]